MLYPDQADVDDMRRADPHGRHSTAELERRATVLKLTRVVGDVQDDLVRDILETIIDLL